MDSGLKKTLFLCALSGLICALVLSSLFFFAKQKSPLLIKTQSLQKVKTELLLMRESLPDIERGIRAAQTAVPGDLGAVSSEAPILSSLDGIKLRMRDAEVRVSQMEDKESEVGLPVGIKGVMTDYTVFVNQVGYLQSLRFPFFRIKSVTIQQPQGNESSGVSYGIEGVLKMPKIQGAPASAGQAPLPPPGISITERRPVTASALKSPVTFPKKRDFPQTRLAEIAPQPEERKGKKVSLILVRGDSKTAIINGIVVKEGDNIDSARVVRIEKSRVLLKDKTGEEWIRLE